MATFQRNQPLPPHPRNGDEERYRKKIASFTKALPHNQLGEVNLSAFDAMVDAINSKRANNLESIPLGGSVKLGNPQGAFAFDLEGADSHHLGMPAPPPFASAQEAAEMAELYWQALTRDVPFDAYDTDASIQNAAQRFQVPVLQF